MRRKLHIQMLLLALLWLLWQGLSAPTSAHDADPQAVLAVMLRR